MNKMKENTTKELIWRHGIVDLSTEDEETIDSNSGLIFDLFTKETSHPQISSSLYIKTLRVWVYEYSGVSERLTIVTIFIFTTGVSRSWTTKGLRPLKIHLHKLKITKNYQPSLFFTVGRGFDET